jgi:hypothetical protein
MANSDRDIRIVPDRGASTQPVMYFTGADSLSSATIVLRVFNSSTDATLSFEGDIGQLLSITDSTFGPVFSVNDISGIPSIEVLDSGLVKLAEWNGKVQVGGANNNENATSTTTGELQVIGGVGVSRDVFVGGGMTVVGTLNAAVIAGSISNSANVGVTNDTASSTAQYLTFVSGTSGNLPIKVDSSALTFVPSTNNLGIGTTNPYSKLSLVSSAATDGISLFTSAYEAGRQWGHRIWKNDTGAGIPLQIDTQQTTTWYTTIRMGHGQDTNNPALITYYNTQLAMTSGNVGVGITPTSKLHVSGDSKVAGTFVGLRQYQTGDDFRIDFVKAANDTASARFEWNGYSSASSHLIDYFSIGLNDSASAMQTRFQIMPDGRIGLNTTDFTYTSSDNAAVVAGGIDANKVFVNGSIQLLGNNNAIVFGRGTSSFLKDEELGFGWGGGWHMTDATFLRSRNNKHIYNEAPYSGSSFRNFASSYDAPNLFMVHPTDTNWTFGASSNNSDTYWMQVKYSGAGNDNRGFRVLDVASGIVRMAVSDRITTHQNTFYRTWQSYTGSDNGPMKTWDGVLVAGSDYSGAQAFTIIDTTVPQDSYMMGGFTIEWFENYASTNAKTSITLSGYWNAESNGGFVGWEYTSSNPNIVPTIRIARNVSTGNTSFILTHFSSNYAIVLARDLWLGYSGGDATYGSGWAIRQQADTTGYTNIDTVVARTAQPAGSGSGSGLNADLLDGIDSTGFVRNSAATSGYINIDGGTQNSPTDATVFITATNNNDWGLIVNKFNGSATEYGQEIRVGSAATYAFRVMGSGSETFRVNGAGHVFSPLYYDINNAAYYGDFASTSNINALQTAGQVVIGGTFANQAFSSATGARLMFGGGDGDAQINYYIGTNLENYGGTYNKLDLRWHTGIRMGAQPSYGGIRFYDTEDLGTQIFAIGKDGSFAQANQSMRAPIFYDLDNTSYYVDPTSITSLRTVGSWRSDSSTWDGDFSGKIQYHGNHWYIQAADLFIYRNAGGSNVFTINQSGSAVATGDMRAPIFYDSNNTGFYVDPASTSNLNVLNVATLNISGTIPASTAYLPRLSGRDFGSGTLVQTSINYAVTNGDPFVIEITGNSYGQIVPWDIQIQGYIYADTIINTAGISNGTNITGIRAINFNGNLCFWWPRQSYWNGFTVYVYTAYDTFQPNRVTSITDVAQPTTAKQVVFTVYQNYGNHNSSSFDATFNRLYSNTDIRAPIYYDSNNTGFYLDPASNSELNRINTVRANNFLYLDNNYGHSIVGLYDSTRYQGVFAMGDAYKLPAAGTSPGNLYGIAWSHPNAGGVAGNLNTHGALILENGTFLAALSGSIRSRDDMRSPIFYDSNNTGFYADLASTSNINRITNDTNQRFNIHFRGTPRSDITSDQNYWTTTQGWGTDYGTWDTAWQFGFGGFDFWGSSTGHPQGSGYIHAQGIQSGLHYATSGGGQAYGWQMVGAANATENRYWARGKWGGSTSAWKEFAMYGTTGVGGSQSASIYYDSDNSAFFCDPAGRSRLSSMDYGDGGYYFAGGDWGYRHNTPFGWIQFGPANTGHAHIYTDRSNFYFNAQLQVNGGSQINTSDIRANIFYDQNNTGYYVDPNGSTSLRTVGDWRADSSGWTGEFPGKIQYHSNNWYFQYNTEFLFRNAGGSNVFYGDNGGNTFSISSSRAPIFYDTNNTGFYVDPNGTSNLNRIDDEGTVGRWWEPKGVGGDSGNGGHSYRIFQEGGAWSFPFPDLRIAYHTGIKLGANASYEGIRMYTDNDMSSRVIQFNGPSNYIYMDRWVNVTGHQGIYSGTNGAHIYPNNGTYGSWKCDGSRNGWQGMEFGGTTIMMNDDTYGFHRNSQGWRFYVTGGSGYFPGEVTAYWSDRRLKENIETLSFGEGTALINKLKPSRFNWRIDLEEIAPNLKGAVKPGKEEVGLIAQEVQEVLPDAVKENLSGRSAGKGSDTESYLTVNYDRIVPFLIQAIQELTAKVASLESQINGKN